MPQAPSQFYKCPHCGHILLKDRVMMSLAGTGAGFGIVGGGCPDCHQPLDAEAVYVAGKYDISMAEIAKAAYGKTLIQNILAAHQAGKVQLTPEELSLLSLEPPLRQRSDVPQNGSLIKSRHKDLIWVIPTVLVIVAAVFIVVFSSRPKVDAFGMPAVVKSTVLSSSGSGSKIISAQPVTKNGLEMWCVVTDSGAGQQHWVVSGSVTGDNAASMILEAGMPSDFSKLGCTNWGGTIAAATSTVALPTDTNAPATSAPVFSVPAYGISIPYDPSVWKINSNYAGVSALDIASCLIEGPYTAWNPVPDRPAEIQVDNGDLVYDVYLDTRDGKVYATYFIKGGIDRYDFATKAPIVLYVSANTSNWEACKTAAGKLIEDFAATP